MAKEIEKKFLLKNKDWKLNCSNNGACCAKIKQGYISSENGKVVRIRTIRTHIEHDKYSLLGYITIKGPTKGISRDEFEYPIPFNDANKMLKTLCSDIIEKTRHTFKVNTSDDYKWEVDVFHGLNKGLIIAEVELKTATQKINKPKWLGIDVTKDRKYSNSNLAKKPYSKWDKK